MPLMPWTPLLSVGIREIDEQHKILFNLANEFDEAARIGRAHEILERIFDELIRYAEFHFDTEERLMKRLAYLGTESHLLEHEQLRRSIDAFRARFRNGEPDLTQEVVNFFRDWLTHHIMNSDQRLGRELSRSGVR